MESRLKYYNRIFSAYLTNHKSHLSFWHGDPQVNDRFQTNDLDEYYMLFFEKADYTGQYDAVGIPMLDYRGEVGLQYNPIAIAQYGLGNYNFYKRNQEQTRFDKCLRAADWLVRNLEKNHKGIYVWNHHFDWEYRDKLKAPWYSALAQGQGISLLVRVFKETGRQEYKVTADQALISFTRETEEGGVAHTDERGYVWFEETIVNPPTHILNGFIWAMWGVYDYYFLTRDEAAQQLFQKAVQTLEDNLKDFDCGFWSLYEQSGTRLKMLASPFYHRLHIVQLRIMAQLTGKEVFARYAARWEGYCQDILKRNLAYIYKAFFKLCYY